MLQFEDLFGSRQSTTIPIGPLPQATYRHTISAATANVIYLGHPGTETVSQGDKARHVLAFRLGLDASLRRSAELTPTNLSYVLSVSDPRAVMTGLAWVSVGVRAVGSSTGVRCGLDVNLDGTRVRSWTYSGPPTTGWETENAWVQLSGSNPVVGVSLSGGADRDKIVQLEIVVQVMHQGQAGPYRDHCHPPLPFEDINILESPAGVFHIVPANSLAGLLIVGPWSNPVPVPGWACDLVVTPWVLDTSTSQSPGYPIPATVPLPLVLPVQMVSFYNGQFGLTSSGELLVNW